MSYLTIAVGWALIGVLVVVFADMTGVIRSSIFHDKSVLAELMEKKIVSKLFCLISLILIYLYLKNL